MNIKRARHAHCDIALEPASCQSIVDQVSADGTGCDFQVNERDIRFHRHLQLGQRIPLAHYHDKLILEDEQTPISPEPRTICPEAPVDFAADQFLTASTKMPHV